MHIEAAEKSGQRFNESMSNEQRRHFTNLMLMCYDHHVITNDTVKYDVAALQRFKREHESKFSDPDRAILSVLVDVTTLRTHRKPKNLRRVLGRASRPNKSRRHSGSRSTLSLNY